MHDAQHQEEIRSSREAAKSIRSSPAQLNPNRQSSHPPSEILQLLSVEFPAGYLQWTREGTKKLEGVVSTDSRYRVPARSSRVQVSATRRSGRERTGAADSKAMEIYLELSNGARKVRATINRQLQALELSVEQIQSSSRRTRRAPPACEVRLTDQEASHVIRQYCDEGRREEGGGASREAPVYYWHGSQDDDV
ncbi:hypothetical protein GUITHDRAFT_150409 [Guillardia theta CCMP2712]|uniref:Uncharacterized protein n=1 Tax=Guillardia theta (strain CCMP2712) TaxID=905079 RepID=L1JXY6_GUITC|nr:hypothetical protein GUITHDRAFT_150409 [Guillardia theta CCMP2712]EKX53431.1 hypothetical protein GUITHDRAFT_150409 [Guillardia theta CCMP2712]|eukprot:XP_005840411.1 hypothetical protein GUITHDRAFT_150409 [Guillardia theta CCMP2712]